ncbi:metalloprotease [Zunongwangia sp.]|uniref:metalloprotease n=1 Tax=Zunongwangia sp. TaxID=1965325 RepID=UPI003AA8E4AC
MKNCWLLLCSCFFICSGLWSQNSTYLQVTLNKDKKTLHITQQLTYTNTASTPLTSIFLNDWANAFKDQFTPLAKRFGEEYIRKIHFSKNEEKGFTSIQSITSNSENIKWIRPKLHPDIIEIQLNKALAPSEEITFNLQYSIRVPSDKFTRFGVSKNGNYKLRFWYLTPAVYQNGWKIYSHKDLGKQFTPPTTINIQLTLPKEFQIYSSLNTASEKTTKNSRYIHLTGLSRTNQPLYCIQTYEFDKINLDRHTIITNLEDDGLQNELKSTFLERILNFLESRLGKFPHKNLLITKEEYLKNPVYGLNQLPSFVRPFPDGFQYDIKQLKTITNYFLNQTLLVNPREEQWLHDAIETSLMMDYVDTFYPKMKLIGSLSNFIGIRWFHLADLEFNDRYPLFYMNMARLNIDQALETKKDSLLKFNSNIANPYKAGIGFKYLENYLGDNTVNNTITEFYQQHQLEVVKAEVFGDLLQENAKKDISWFFEDYLNTNKKIDFKISKIKKSRDSLKVTIQNKKDATVPIPVYGLKNDSIIYKSWVTSISDKKTITIPRNNADKIALNYEQIVPEFNQRNNFKKVTTLLNRPIQFRLLEDVEDPKYAQVFFIPEFDYNLYDGFSIGPKMYNTTFLSKNFNYKIAPKYGFASHTILGSAGFSYQQQFRDKRLRSIRFGVSGTRFSYAYDLYYKKYTPFLSFAFRPLNLRDNQRQNLLIRNVNVTRDNDPNQTINKPDYNIFNVKYAFFDAFLVDRTSALIDYQLAKHFSKASVTLKYRKLFENSRQINLRLFAGAFIYNDTRDSNYFSFALDRPTDYLFDYNYYGRSESSGLFSQQLIMAEGGFKSQLTPQYANQWITSLNTSTNIWKWIFAYGDAGLIKNKGESTEFLYDSGIRVSLVEDYFELFFPVYSNLGWEPSLPDYENRIRFIVALDLNTLIKLFTRKWY